MWNIYLLISESFIITACISCLLHLTKSWRDIYRAAVVTSSCVCVTCNWIFWQIPSHIDIEKRSFLSYFSADIVHITRNLIKTWHIKTMKNHAKHDTSVCSAHIDRPIVSNNHAWDRLKSYWKYDLICKIYNWLIYLLAQINKTVMYL